MNNQQPREVEKEQQQHIQSQQKAANPVRFVYNVTPATRQAAFNAAIPNAVHYTPFMADIDPDVIAQTKGLMCQKCRSYLNLYCQIIQSKKLWICCICKQPNTLPENIPKTILDTETYDKYSDQKDFKSQTKEKLYLFLIDLCISNKQMKSIVDSLLEFVNFKAEESYEGVNFVNRIGIITFSKFVYCYELASSLNTVICISADHYYQTDNILRFLSLKPENNKQAIQKFFVNPKTARDKLERRIKKLKAQGSVQFDDDPVKRCRAKRSYGQAINVALSLCESLTRQCRIISLVGGPSTYGVGTTIGIDFRQQMRSIKQLQNGENVNYFQSSSNYYQTLKKKIQAKKTIIDLFIFSVQETGLTELYGLIKLSGGLLVLGEQFSGDLKIFQQSFRKAYISGEDNQMACSLVSSCVMSVSCSGDIKINGALGCCKPIQSVVVGKHFVSDKPIGFGDTNLWYIGGMDCYRTLTFIYELSSSKAFDLSYYIQFRTSYKDYWGFNKVRITTVKRIWDTNSAIVCQNFDQEAAIVALARWYLYRQSFQPKANFRQWIDKMLVRWTSNYANFIKGDCQSFSLPQKMKFLPQFVYHFRRNPLIRKAGLSLDELTYQTHRLNIETVEHSLTIIQPALLSYTIQKPFPSPVRLEQQQMKNSVILLLDTYFHVLLWYGQNIEYWQKQKFHKQKQYQHVKALLQAPQQDVSYLLNSRFPYPGFYLTSTGHSKQRILKSKISPKISEVQNQNLLTDDKSVHVFMKALIQIIVNGKTSIS